MAALVMPRLSDSMEEGTIIRWLVADGSPVAVGQELAEIETDKAVMTYEAESAGVLAIVASAGATVAVGDPIAELRATNGVAPAAARGPRVSPVARRMATELGVALHGLVGTGPEGRIVKRDVLAAVAREPAAPTADSAKQPPPAPAPAPLTDAPHAEPTAATARGVPRRQELSRLQHTVARRMVEAKATQPEFTLSVDVDMDAALALRGELKSAAESARTRAPSVNDLVIRAVAQALRAHPRANGAYRDGAFELYERVNVGFAVAGEDALIVPVVHDADRLALGEIAARTGALAARARDRTLTPPELAGGTFTISNLGMFGIAAFTAILNASQAGILAVGTVRQVPVVSDGAVRVGGRMTLTLTCDHRILYGADAAAFLDGVRRRLEQPLLLIL